MAFLICFAMVLLSGFTGLVYQVTWQKYLSIYLGSHALATCLVLSTFFLFMALGYSLLGKYSPRLMKNKILLYGVIEGLIGFYAFLSPSFFHWLYNNFSLSQLSGTTELAAQTLLASAFIGFPTFLMGGTIPVLTQGLVRNFQKSHRIHALIYGLNTFGAFFVGVQLDPLGHIRFRGDQAVIFFTLVHDLKERSTCHRFRARRARIGIFDHDHTFRKGWKRKQGGRSCGKNGFHRGHSCIPLVRR